MAKLLIVIGLGIALFGGMLWLLSGIPGLRLGRLPGDIAVQRDGFTFYLPLRRC